MSGDHLNQHSSPAAAAGDWEFGNSSTISMYQGMQVASSSSCPQISMAAGSLYPNPWAHPSNLQNSEIAMAAAAHNMPTGKPVPLPRFGVGMFPPANPAVLPPGLPNFPADSSFIDRAAKFSSFSAGNFSALLNPFGPSIPGGQIAKSEAVKDGSMPIVQVNNGGGGETPDVANASADSSSKGLSSKKRKNGRQDMELDQAQESSQFSPEVPKKENAETKQNVECSTSTQASGKSSGKNAKGNTDGAKQDYIHVRARRGQATNSHSLAERVRRERISERMKYLQDLVPGCSKVTGKAVMLDEIINYVQSLQRQVEFLSMKLAAVNPNIDLNIEGLLSKDMLQPRIGQPPVGFSPDLINPQLLQSQQGLAQTGVPGMVNHADALRMAVNAQFTAMNVLKESTSQMPHQWEAELQNMLQMNYSTNPPPSGQEYSGKPRDGFPL